MSGACCCCCPPAISALFCLWVQSGCSKGTVAGALTFFPPDPSLYKFERHYGGKVLADDEKAPSGNGDKVCEDKKGDTPVKSTDDDDSVGTLEGPLRTGPLEETANNKTGQTQQKIKSPIQSLTDQAKERRKKAMMYNERNNRDIAAGVTYKLLLDPRLQVPPHDHRAIECVQIPTCSRARKSASCSTVATIIYRVPPERQHAETKTLIISHGNATDIGAMFPIQVVLAHSLDCNVVSFDYSGYGESGGVPDENATYRDLEVVYEYVVESVANGIESNVVLYGQSVGSGPCCYVAANTRSNKPGGLILHSPFTSGMRVITESRLLACLDIYPNIDRIKKVNCPVMVIHGVLDEEVDVSHGHRLHDAVPSHLQREPWWVSDRGHNDITDGPGKLAEYVRRLRTFLTSLSAPKETTSE